MEFENVRKAVIPAGGKGTRLLPATKAIPKEMFPVVDKPVIQYVVEEAVESGIHELAIVTSKEKQAIEKHFTAETKSDPTLTLKKNKSRWAMIEEISRQIQLCIIHQDLPLGLGHAVKMARSYIGDQSFAVLLADDIMFGETPVLKQLLQVHRLYGGAVIAVKEVPFQTVSDYGILAVESINEGLEDRLYRVRSMVEKPTQQEAPSNLAIMGRYILPPRIFGLLDETIPGALGEIQLTDGIQSLLEEGQAVYAYRFDGERFEVGDSLAFLRANIEIALKHSDLRKEFRKYLQTLMR